MPSVIVALFLAIGASGWVYAKITRRTGGNTQSDITVVAVVGIIAFFVTWTLLSTFMD